MSDSQVTLLLHLIDQAFDHRAWHGTNLRGSVRRVNTGDAAWRPAVGRHNIWEIVVHAAYWKYVVRRRFTGESRGSFPVKGSNWFLRPSNRVDAEQEWKSDLALMIETHRAMREAIANMTMKDLRQTPKSSKFSNEEIIMGAASHDLYHAGQIQLLKRLRDTVNS